jgi:hypothetical protein
LALASGAILFQSACTTSLAAGTAGLLSSITNQLVSNIVNKAFGIETFPFSLAT